MPQSERTWLGDFVNDAVIGADAEYRIAYWNTAAAKLFGWTADEAIGHVSLELMQVEFPGSSLEIVVAAVAAGGWHGTTRGRAKDGHVMVCETSVAELPDRPDSTLRYIVVTRDVTEREAAARQLENAVALADNLFNAAPVGFITYELSGPCVDCNAEAARIVGGTIEELRRLNFRTMESWKASGLLQLAERAIATGEIQSSDVSIHTTFGKEVWVLARATVVHTTENDRLLLVMSDLTAVKQKDDALRVLMRAIDQSRSSIMITNRDGVIEYVNPATLAVSGYSHAEVIGQNPRLFKAGETAPEAYRDLWRTIVGGETWHGELCNRSKNGDLFWERAVISPVTNDQAEITHFVAMKEDITAQKRAEQLAREAELRFQRAQKMEVVGRLAGGVAHDFNNLLTVILGYSQFVMTELESDRVKADVREIEKAGERAARLTRQLLAFSRTQRAEPKVLDVNQLIAELTKMLSRLVGEDIRIDVLPGEGLAAVKLDPTQLEQVIMNLVVNARDAMPTGGTLTITTANACLNREAIPPRFAAAPGPFVAIRVSDTGTGMPPEVLARIFEPFFSTKPIGKGTGLGLAVVSEVVTEARGCVTIDTKVGIGTTFTIYVPTVDPDSAPAGRPVTHGVRVDGTETVLLVEDVDSVRTLVERTLVRRGYRVLSSPDGEQALAIEARHDGPIDLLLSDIVMPGMAGPTVAQRLVRRRPAMKVLYISGFPNGMASSAGTWSRRTNFLPKPFTPDGLALKVREVLAS